MMVMIYFSGTGNSKYIAELFSEKMGISCYSIEDDVNFEELINSKETIGFCYPIYYSRVPKILREFVSKHMNALKNKKLIIFCTQQILSGDGTRAFTDLFDKSYIQVIYTEHFFMPSNIFPIITNQEKIAKYVNKAKHKMQRVCQDIKTGKVKRRGFNIGSRALGLIQAPLLSPCERKASNSIKITEDCTKCGLCVSICPMNNFTIENNAVKHNHNCTMCARCVNKCPNKAVMVFFNGKVKKQYPGVNTVGTYEKA